MSLSQLLAPNFAIMPCIVSLSYLFSGFCYFQLIAENWCSIYILRRTWLTLGLMCFQTLPFYCLSHKDWPFLRHFNIGAPRSLIPYPILHGVFILIFVDKLLFSFIYGSIPRREIYVYSLSFFLPFDLLRIFAREVDLPRCEWCYHEKYN
jgi:hypothetical protein